MIRFIIIKIYDNTFKKSLRRKCSKVIFITIKNLQYRLYNLLLLNCYLLGVKMNLGHADKTRFWYLLRVFLKFSDEHPRHFYRGVTPRGPSDLAILNYVRATRWLAWVFIKNFIHHHWCSFASMRQKQTTTQQSWVLKFNNVWCSGLVGIKCNNDQLYFFHAMEKLVMLTFKTVHFTLFYASCLLSQTFINVLFDLFVLSVTEMMSVIVRVISF